MIKLSKNFTLDELTKTQHSGISNIPNAEEIANLKKLVINVLQPIRDCFNLPIIVNSGFRSEELNKIVGGVKNSQHCKGEAADIVIEGVSVQDVYDQVLKEKFPFDQMINEFDKWLHISYSEGSNRFQHFKKG